MGGKVAKTGMIERLPQIRLVVAFNLDYQALVTWPCRDHSALFPMLDTDY